MEGETKNVWESEREEWSKYLSINKNELIQFYVLGCHFNCSMRSAKCIIYLIECLQCLLLLFSLLLITEEDRWFFSLWMILMTACLTHFIFKVVFTHTLTLSRSSSLDSTLFLFVDLFVCSIADVNREMHAEQWVFSIVRVLIKPERSRLNFCRFCRLDKKKTHLRKKSYHGRRHRRPATDCV